MALTTEEIRQAICGKIAGYPVRSGYGDRITVPFTDRYGAPLVVYINKAGQLTDAAEYLSEIHAMGASEEWVEWAHRDEFLARNNIAQVGRELRAESTERPSDILAYLQGLARVTAFFDIQAQDTGDSKFVHKVRRKMRDELIEYAPHDGAVSWIGARMKKKKTSVGGIPVELDFTPLDDNVLVQVIGYQEASPSQQLSHARKKTHAFLAAHVMELEARRSAPQFARVAVVPDLQDYGPSSRKLIDKSSTYVLEFENTGGHRELARALATPQIHAEFL